MANFTLGKVLRVSPESHAADVMLLESGRILRSIPIMTPFASTNTGLVDLPDPTPESEDAQPIFTGERDMIAGVLKDGQFTYIIGFLFPQVAQAMFQDSNRRIMRHASDVYSSIDKDGNIELHHPSGTYVRFGVTPDHEDLTGQDSDGEWKIDKNTDKKIHLQVVVKNGGEQKAMFHADPDGNVTVTGKGTLDANFEGKVTVETQDEILAKSPAKVTVDAPDAHFTGNISAEGNIAAGGDVSDSKSSIQAMRDTYNSHQHADPQGGKVQATTSKME
ncbi:MAG TPA: hypothetical protein VFM97_00045 [Gammaproteobacteria bacterium]|nr:hypothetical protein [Gammaproteobacteria bacterium]